MGSCRITDRGSLGFYLDHVVILVFESTMSNRLFKISAILVVRCNGTCHQLQPPFASFCKRREEEIYKLLLRLFLFAGFIDLLEHLYIELECNLRRFSSNTFYCHCYLVVVDGDSDV
ncbi:hypothetical protein ABZP36_022645 [Zizania latifolia]